MAQHPAASRGLVRGLCLSAVWAWAEERTGHCCVEIARQHRLPGSLITGHSFSSTSPNVMSGHMVISQTDRQAADCKSLTLLRLLLPLSYYTSDAGRRMARRHRCRVERSEPSPCLRCYTSMGWIRGERRGIPSKADLQGMGPTHQSRSRRSGRGSRGR